LIEQYIIQSITATAALYTLSAVSGILSYCRHTSAEFATAKTEIYAQIIPEKNSKKLLFSKKNHEATQQSCEREKAKLLVCFGVDGQHLIDAYLHIIQHPTDKSLIIQQNK